jgi:Fe2+ transport system protein B
MDGDELPSLDIPDTPIVPTVSTTQSSTDQTVKQVSSTSDPTQPNTKISANTRMTRKASVVNVLHSTPRWKQFINLSMGDRTASQNLVQALNELEQVVLSEQSALQSSKNYKLKHTGKMLKSLEDLTYFQLGSFFTENQQIQKQLWKLLQISIFCQLTI